MTLIDLLSSALGSGYRVERELPPGGMSRVVIARDLTLDREVVVKVLAGNVSGLSTERFRQEIQLLARLQHPHVIPILSAGVVDERPYYTMPFVQGESLRARLAREGRLPVDHAVRILRDTLDALAFAHGQGVIHRDIKPDNILLSTGHAVVADFGIAKALSAAGFATTAGIALGTPAYMAPEQALADPASDHRVDLYAVGAVAFEMLTGSAPFSGSPQQIISAHITQHPPAVATLRAEVPVALSALVAQALGKDAVSRPASATAMVATLDRILGQLSGGVSQVPVRTPKRRPAMAAAGAIALAIAGGAWYALRPTVSEAARTLAIIPFSAPSGDTSLVRLGRDLASTVSLSLDGVGSLTVADPSATIALAIGKPQPLTTASSLEIARELRSRSILTGVIVRDGAGVRLDVRLLDVQDTTSVLARATVIAANTDVSSLTDSLSWAVLREIWNKGTPPSPSLGSVTTRSVPALRAFLEGERLWSNGDVMHADSAYKIAATTDTAFWLAAYKYREARAWFGRSVDTLIGNRLRRNRDRLPERERAMALMDTFTNRDARIRAMVANTERYPDYAPAWMKLGDYQMHWAGFAGHVPGDALPALRRWMALMPGDRTAIGHVGLACLSERQWACADSTMRMLDSLQGRGSVLVGESAAQRAFLHAANDAAVDSALFARDSTLGPGVSVGLYEMTGVFARRPWLLDISRAPLGVPPAMAAILKVISDPVRGTWTEPSRTAWASLPVLTRSERTLTVTTRALAAAVGLNVDDRGLPSMLDANAADASMTVGEHLDNAMLMLQPRFARRDTMGYGAALALAVSDTTFRGRLFARSLRAQRDLAMGTRGAIDSLLAIERDQGQRYASLALLARNRTLLLDSLLARGNAALVDSLSRFLIVSPGNNTVLSTIAGVAPGLMLSRVRALETLGRRDDALVLARGMQAIVKPLTPPSAALKAAYGAIAQRLDASSDAGRATVVPGKR